MGGMGSWRNLLCVDHRPLQNVLGCLVFFDLNIFHLLLLLPPPFFLLLLSCLFFLFFFLCCCCSSIFCTCSFLNVGSAFIQILFYFHFSLSHFDRLKAPWQGGQVPLPLAFSQWSNLSELPSPFPALLYILVGSHAHQLPNLFPSLDLLQPRSASANTASLSRILPFKEEPRHLPLFHLFQGHCSSLTCCSGI